MGYGDDREPILFIEDIVAVLLIEAPSLNFESGRASELLNYQGQGATWSLIGRSSAVN